LHGGHDLGLARQPFDTFNAATPILILAIAAGHAVQILKRYYEEYASLGKDEPPSVDHPGFASAIAENEDELKEALDAGWSQTYTAANGPVKAKFSTPKTKFGAAPKK
jgi:hypothetical protein